MIRLALIIFMTASATIAQETFHGVEIADESPCIEYNRSDFADDDEPWFDSVPTEIIDKIRCGGDGEDWIPEHNRCWFVENFFALRWRHSAPMTETDSHALFIPLKICESEQRWGNTLECRAAIRDGLGQSMAAWFCPPGMTASGHCWRKPTGMVVTEPVAAQRIREVCQ